MSSKKSPKDKDLPEKEENKECEDKKKKENPSFGEIIEVFTTMTPPDLLDKSKE